MNKYGPKAQKLIHDVIKEYDRGDLKNGKSGKKVTNRKQAVAIGVSEARSHHYKVPTSK